MKRGERIGIGLTIGILGVVLVSTVYLELRHQTNAGQRHQAQDERMRRMLSMLPKGFTHAQLPDPDSDGAKGLGLYCVQCHELPMPGMHTAQEWEQVLARMRLHMDERRGGMLMRIMVPGEREDTAITEYLKRHALRGITPEALADSNSPPARAYAQVCSTCHALPEPTLHTSKEWALTVLRMKRYIEDAALKLPDETSMQLVRQYLARY